MDFSRKGHRKGLKGDSDVTRENVHSKHRGAASSEVAESAAKESTFPLLFLSSPLPLQLPLGLLPALPRENRSFSFGEPRSNLSIAWTSRQTSCSLRTPFEVVETGEPRESTSSYKIIKVAFSNTRPRQIIRTGVFNASLDADISTLWVLTSLLDAPSHRFVS